MIRSTNVIEQKPHLCNMRSPLKYVVPKVIADIGLYDIQHHHELLHNIFS